VDAVASPDRGQRRNLLLQVPVEHVVVELDVWKCWCLGLCQDTVEHSSLR
jgi:hypothetical protein